MPVDSTLPHATDLSYFLEIAHTLNISRAAERLGISQPSLSQAVKRLERQTGSSLLLRGQSGVQLTRTGQRFAAQARRIIQDWERITAQLRRDERLLAGRYVLGCHAAVALYALPALLAALLAAHPELEFKLVHALSRQVNDLVIAFQIDFGLVINPARHPDLVIRTLGSDEVTLWMAPGRRDLLAAARDGAGALVCDPELLQTQALQKEMARAGLGFARTVSSSSLELVAELTAAGAGIGVLPGRVAQRPRAKKLVRVPGAPTYPDRICLVYRADAQRTVASKTLIEALAGCLDGT